MKISKLSSNCIYLCSLITMLNYGNLQAAGRNNRQTPPTPTTLSHEDSGKIESYRSPKMTQIVETEPGGDSFAQLLTDREFELGKISREYCKATSLAPYCEVIFVIIDPTKIDGDNTVRVPKPINNLVGVSEWYQLIKKSMEPNPGLPTSEQPEILLPLNEYGVTAQGLDAFIDFFRFNGATRGIKKLDGQHHIWPLFVLADRYSTTSIEPYLIEKLNEFTRKDSITSEYYFAIGAIDQALRYDLLPFDYFMKCISCLENQKSLKPQEEDMLIKMFEDQLSILDDEKALRARLIFIARLGRKEWENVSRYFRQLPLEDKSDPYLILGFFGIRHGSDKKTRDACEDAIRIKIDSNPGKNVFKEALRTDSFPRINIKSRGAAISNDDLVIVRHSPYDSKIAKVYATHVEIGENQYDFKQFKLPDAKEGTPPAHTVMGKKIEQLFFKRTKDGETEFLVAISKENIFIWDLNNPEEKYRISAPQEKEIEHFAFSEDLLKVAIVYSTSDTKILIFSLITNEQSSFKPSGTVKAVTFVNHDKEIEILGSTGIKTYSLVD